MVIKEKLYMLAKDHGSDEAQRLVDLVEDDGDLLQIIDAKNDFITLLAQRCEINQEDYEDLYELAEEAETIYTGDDDDIPEGRDD